MVLPIILMNLLYMLKRSYLLGLEAPQIIQFDIGVSSCQLDGLDDLGLRNLTP